MPEDKAPPNARFQWEPGDIQWEVGPSDVPQEQRDAAAEAEATQRAEGRKLILKEKVLARKRAKGKKTD
jgi:hypothetical protein